MNFISYQCSYYFSFKIFTVLQLFILVFHQHIAITSIDLECNSLQVHPSLLSLGADINAQTEETQETALTLACCGGFRDVADLLIKAGADLELGASTPLMEAAQEGHRDLVE